MAARKWAKRRLLAETAGFQSALACFKFAQTLGEMHYCNCRPVLGCLLFGAGHLELNAKTKAPKATLVLPRSSRITSTRDLPGHIAIKPQAPNLSDKGHSNAGPRTN
jgi:hypothetical protein